MGLQSCESLNFRNKLGVPDKMTFGCWPRCQAQRILWRGRCWFLSSSNHGESCEFVFVNGLSVHQKGFNYALTNLLFGLCRSMWIIDPLVTRLSPHSGALARPSTPEMLQVRNVPQLLILPLFSPWTHIWVYQGAWQCVTCFSNPSTWVLITTIGISIGSMGKNKVQEIMVSSIPPWIGYGSLVVMTTNSFWKLVTISLPT